MLYKGSAGGPGGTGYINSGGIRYQAGAAGGSGGGAVEIIGKSVDLRGSISANGAAGASSSNSGGAGGVPVPYKQATTGLALYDLKNDIGETADVKDQHPEIVQRFGKAAEEARDDLGDKLTKRHGKNIRPHDVLEPGDERLQ